MEENKETEKRKELQKKFGGVFLIYIVITMFIFLIFPKKLLGNIYVLIAYLIGCLYLIFKFYRFKNK